VIAVFRPIVGETFRLVFRDDQENESFSLDFALNAAESTEPDGHATQLQSGVVLPGWHLLCNPIDAAPIANKPGTYQVFHRAADKEIHIGTVALAHVPAPELTSEEIAAIRSDPFAIKFVRVHLECRECRAGVRGYAALERGERLEGEGWTRDVDLPDYFRCDCGKASFSLQYMKTGLRGLLQRRSQPLTTNNIDYVSMYEKSALEDKCRQFSKLLDEGGREERLQEFLEKNPIFFARFNPQRLMVKSPVLSMRNVDFAILNERKELLLIEIENSSTRLLIKDGGIASELQHAADQVREWLQTFSDHRAAALACLKLKLEDVAKVRGIVIAGRTPKNDLQARLLRSVGWPDVEFYTFDDLVSAAVEIIRHLNS
jgi:Shedu protein SduA, C-terminal